MSYRSKWIERKQEILTATDKLGKGMDPLIVDTVVALSLLGFNTTGSCQGHLTHGCLSPWVHIDSYYINEEVEEEICLYQRIVWELQKKGITENDPRLVEALSRHEELVSNWLLPEGQKEILSEQKRLEDLVRRWAIQEKYFRPYHPRVSVARPGFRLDFASGEEKMEGASRAKKSAFMKATRIATFSFTYFLKRELEGLYEDGKI